MGCSTDDPIRVTPSRRTLILSLRWVYPFERDLAKFSLSLVYYKFYKHVVNKIHSSFGNNDSGYWTPRLD